MRHLIEFSEDSVIVKTADLNRLINKVDELEKTVKKLLKQEPAPSTTEYLKSSDIIEDLDISRNSFERLMYNSYNPLPMIKLQGRYRIRRDKYEAWKKEIGL